MDAKPEGNLMRFVIAVPTVNSTAARKMKYIFIIDDPDFEPLKGWERTPFLEGYVHFDPLKINAIDVYSMIDDYMNGRNEKLYE